MNLMQDSKLYCKLVFIFLLFVVVVFLLPYFCFLLLLAISWYMYFVWFLWCCCCSCSSCSCSCRCLFYLSMLFKHFMVLFTNPLVIPTYFHTYWLKVPGQALLAFTTAYCCCVGSSSLYTHIRIHICVPLYLCVCSSIFIFKLP